MRLFLKVLAVCMLVCTLAAAALAAYQMHALKLDVISSDKLEESAGQQQDVFNSWKQMALSNSFPGVTADRVAEEIQPEDCMFESYTVRVKNKGFLPAEWIALEAEPCEGDLLIMPDASPRVLNARSEGDLTAAVLRRADAASEPRALVLTYYIMGTAYQIQIHAEE